MKRCFIPSTAFPSHAGREHNEPWNNNDENHAARIRRTGRVAGTALGLGRGARAGAAEPASAGGRPWQGDPRLRTAQAAPGAATGWQPFSDRKIRVGIAGYGVCSSARRSVFRITEVEVVAVTDLIPDRCQSLAQACGAPGLSLVRADDQGRPDRAVFIARRASTPGWRWRRWSTKTRRLRRARGVRFDRGRATVVRSC